MTSSVALTGRPDAQLPGSKHWPAGNTPTGTKIGTKTSGSATVVQPSCLALPCPGQQFQI